jgi:hypothetical protein
MNIIHFTYNCEFTYLGDGEVELDNDQIITSCQEYPADEEKGQHGSCFQALLEQFKNHTPKDGDRFLGLMAGRLVFTHDYHGKHDMDLEVAMSVIAPIKEQIKVETHEDVVEDAYREHTHSF